MPDLTAIVDAVRALCPNVIGNPYIPHLPHPKQAKFLGSHPWDDKPGPPFECLFGGAAGGGKSDALLMAAAQYAWKHGHFRGLLLRRTHTELAQSGAIMSRAMQWWIARGVHWDGSNKIMRFPNGATVSFGYHGHAADDARYQGGEWHMVGFDELTHWPDSSAFDWLMSRIRKNVGDPIPRRLLATSNPGSIGHQWVKERFVDGPSMYIRSTIDDNPSLDREDYRATLSMMHPTRQAQLMNGDWSARDPGDYFRAEWFGPLLDPATDIWPAADCIRIRWWDLAASEKEDAAFTSGVRMARHRSGVRAVEHCRSFRATPGKRDDLIVQTAQADGYGVTVGLEIEGGSGGPAQFEALSKRLREKGYRVVGARPRVGAPDLSDREKATMIRRPESDSGKQGRADPVASCLERGYQRRGEGPNTGGTWWGVDANVPVVHQRDGIRLFAGPWTQGYLDVVEGFPDGATCDEVDATSGAWAWLEAHPVGASMPPPLPDRAMASPQDIGNVHPEDRPEAAHEKRNGVVKRRATLQRKRWGT